MCEKLLVLAQFVSPLYGSSVQLSSVDELGWTDNMERVTGVTVLLDSIIRPYSSFFRLSPFCEHIG